MNDPNKLKRFNPTVTLISDVFILFILIGLVGCNSINSLENPQGSMNPITSSNASQVIQLARFRGGEKGPIEAIAWSPDRKYLASAGSTGIQIYDADTLEEIRFIETGSIQMGVAFSPDGKLLASGSYSTVQLWSVANGALVRTMEGKTNFLSSLAFSPDGEKLAAGGAGDTFVYLWDVTNGKILHRLIGHASGVLSVAFSQDGKLLASGSADTNVHLWEVNDGSLIRTMSGHSAEVYSVSILQGSNLLVSGSWDGKIIFWDLYDGRRLRTLEDNNSHFINIALSPNGGLIAGVSAGRHVISVWNVTDGSLFKTIKGSMYAGINCVVFSPDGAILAVGGVGGENTLELWDLTSDQPIISLKGFSSTGSIVAFSHDAKFLASNCVNNESICVWNIADGSLLITIKPSVMSPVTSAVFSIDGKVLATGNMGGVIRLWDISTGNQIGELEGGAAIIESMLRSPNGRLVAANYSDIGFWNFSSGNLLSSIKVNTNTLSNYIESIAISPNGKMLAVGTNNATASIWNIENGDLINTILGNGYEVTSVNFSPDNTLLATGSSDQVVRIWDVGNGSLIRTLAGQYNHLISNFSAPVAFSLDGSILASGIYESIYLWNVADGEHVRLLEVPDEFIKRMTFSDDGTILAIGANDGVHLFGVP